MEDMVNTVIQLINGCGFPIAACIGIFYLYNKTISGITTTLSKLDATLDSVASTLERIDRRTENKEEE